MKTASLDFFLTSEIPPVLDARLEVLIAALLAYTSSSSRRQRYGHGLLVRSFPARSGFFELVDSETGFTSMQRR